MKLRTLGDYGLLVVHILQSTYPGKVDAADAVSDLVERRAEETDAHDIGHN